MSGVHIIRKPFNLFSKTVLRDIEDLNGFIISGHNVANLRYAYDALHSRFRRKATGITR